MSINDGCVQIIEKPIELPLVDVTKLHTHNTSPAIQYPRIRFDIAAALRRDCIVVFEEVSEMDVTGWVHQEDFEVVVRYVIGLIGEHSMLEAGFD